MTNTFDAFDLDEPLQRAIANAGWQQPTPVQQRVIPAVLEGRDLLASAATGSGKTGAFLLPMLQRLSEEPAPDGGIRALVLVPTRELASQTQSEFLSLGSRTRLTSTVIVGGEDRGRQVSALRKNPDLVIATPGRLLEHLETGEADLTQLSFLVLDEADRMLDLGFAADVISIIGASNRERQSLLFSATLKHGGLRPITDHLLNNPLVIEIDAIRAAHPDISHQLILSDELPHKQALLLWLLQNEAYQKALVFTNTRARADAIGTFLVGEQVRAAVLHGELDQRERKRVMGLFERSQVSVLVASDVAARGLDLTGVERVINLDIPRSGEDYLHRTGRTGRAGQAGIAISLVSAPEWNKMESISRWLGIEVELRRLPGLEALFKGPNPKRKSGRKPGGKLAGKAGKKAGKTSASKAGNSRPSTNAKTSTKPAAKGDANSSPYAASPYAANAKGAANAEAPKPKQRHRDRKNIGKRRQPSASSSAGVEQIDAGFAPPKRRPDTDGPSRPSNKKR
ncbi:MAG: DEAD/DEAH box helicase [Lamprobacter sp.]|uniref:DEAD/DEAH box helicase n=1 Tax=Lamprobacter sp. TaxID=3100796 RepID=UPI002B261E3C|nr:DEAD/DEAH box helicase [Lamprobacter sp.]MEA3642049.1 DEAD/DEAH box helicase [Lamprobacter sp.]